MDSGLIGGGMVWPTEEYSPTISRRWVRHFLTRSAISPGSASASGSSKATRAQPKPHCVNRLEKRPGATGIPRGAAGGRGSRRFSTAKGLDACDSGWPLPCAPFQAVARMR